MKCYICQNNFPNNLFGVHLRICKNLHDLNEPIKEIKFKELCFSYKKDFKKEFFEKLYCYEKRSIKNISENYNIIYAHVVFLLNYFSIKKRTHKEECNNENVRKKCADTVNTKYGVRNISQSDEIKKRKSNRFFKNYGVNNIFKDENFKQWILENNFAWNNQSNAEMTNRILKQTKSIKNFWNEPTNQEYCDNIKNNNNVKFHEYLNNLSEDELKIHNKKKGKWWHELSDEQKTATLLKRKQISSNIESKIAEILSFLNISYTRQKFINRMSYDFLLTNTKILIEVQGDFWHANPNIYNDSDVLKYPLKHIKASVLWKIDENKKLNAEKYGYKVICIWESEMKKKSDNELINLILLKLNA